MKSQIQDGRDVPTATSGGAEIRSQVCAGEDSILSPDLHGFWGASINILHHLSHRALFQQPGQHAADYLPTDFLLEVPLSLLLCLLIQVGPAGH